MFYSVRYRLKDSWFWKTLKQVKGDGFLEMQNGRVMEHARFFILMDETRVEVPSNAEFIFSKERFMSIKSQKEQEVGQPIPVKQ